jgi:hypothetical protein
VRINYVARYDRTPTALPDQADHGCRLMASDDRMTRPLRWGITLGLLPIPGPFDEAILLVVALPLLAFYRAPLRDAWSKAA